MAPTVTLVTTILSLGTVLGGVIVVLLLLTLFLRKFGASIPAFDTLFEFFGRRAIHFSFLVALGSIFASLFYSNVAGFLPCDLCWWQRIFLFPQAILFGLSLWKRDRRAADYGIALSGIGILFSIYHTYLQFGGSPFVPCPATGPSCVQRYFLEFGYVTIPTMALTAFALILTLLWAQKVHERTTRLF